MLMTWKSVNSLFEEGRNTYLEWQEKNRHIINADYPYSKRAVLGNSSGDDRDQVFFTSKWNTTVCDNEVLSSECEFTYFSETQAAM